MEKHWHLFATSVGLWTLAVAVMASATVNHRLMTAIWAAMIGLAATCATTVDAGPGRAGEAGGVRAQRHPSARPVDR